MSLHLSSLSPSLQTDRADCCQMTAKLLAGAKRKPRCQCGCILPGLSLLDAAAKRQRRRACSSASAFSTAEAPAAAAAASAEVEAPVVAAALAAAADLEAGD